MFSKSASKQNRRIQTAMGAPHREKVERFVLTIGLAELVTKDRIRINKKKTINKIDKLAPLKKKFF